jgi:hypothetical protein
MILQILENRILYFNPGRSLEFGKLNRFFTFMDHHSGVTGGGINRFSDFSAIERIDMDPESIQAISGIRSVTTATQHPSKAVIYSSHPLGLELARMFETFFHSARIQLRALDDLDGALAWIGAADLKGIIEQLGLIT